MYYSVAVRKKEISGEEAECPPIPLLIFPVSVFNKVSKGNSADYCGMRKDLQTTVYVLCNSAFVLNKSGKTGSAWEERWVAKRIF